MSRLCRLQVMMARTMRLPLEGARQGPFPSIRIIIANWFAEDYAGALLTRVKHMILETHE